jgi:hypothetical protein
VRAVKDVRLKLGRESRRSFYLTENEIFVKQERPKASALHLAEKGVQEALKNCFKIHLKENILRELHAQNTFKTL